MSYSGWLKYNAVYKHGLGATQWVYLGEVEPNLLSEIVEDTFQDLEQQYGDPERIRKGKLSIIETPPREHLEQMVAHYTQQAEFLLKQIDLFKKMM